MYRGRRDGGAVAADSAASAGSTYFERNRKMKRLVWILVVLMLASPAWAAKKLTVQQLKDLLVSLQQDRKTDEEVAAELKQVELTEELTRGAMNKIVEFAPGKHATEQIYVLQALSSTLPPPASDLPAAPAPDVRASHPQRTAHAELAQSLSRSSSGWRSWSQVGRSRRTGGARLVATHGRDRIKN